MSSGSILPAVIAALAADGFEATLGVRGVTFRGVVKASGVEVFLRLVYPDLEFSGPPYVYIENPEELPRRVLPHLDEKNELCVVDRRQFVADRHAAPAEARGIVIRAREVIERGLTRHAVEEIAEEFPQLWGGASVGVEFGSFEGPIEFAADAGNFRRIRSQRGSSPPRGIAIRTSARLSFAEGQARPETLGGLLEWARIWDARLPGRILAALGKQTAADPYCLIVAPNGTVGFELLVSSRGKAQVAALKRPEGWRRFLGGSVAAALPIKRDHGYRADIEYALSRNADGGSTLSGKQLVLVGCGSIGGYLARALCQLGAGRDGGSLVLIDDDTLATHNLGRHALGAADVGRPKVEGCRDQIQRDLPGAAVSARKFLVQSQRAAVMGGDLLIDATGEQGVSEMLNSWMLEARAAAAPFPDVLHVWIEGAGWAVQTFMASDPAFACLRCLKPGHDEPSRFSAVTAGATVELRGGCGEALFTPYGPAAPMMASALAVQHSADWARGHSRPLLRTGRLDWANSRDVKNTNPTISDRCPACGRA
jgi:molybdopterin/thiamine biosynthesis adenylyltransferase